MSNKPSLYQQYKWLEAKIKFNDKRETRLEQKLKRLKQKIYGDASSETK